jgi:hypothetical protein
VWDSGPELGLDQNKNGEANCPAIRNREHACLIRGGFLGNHIDAAAALVELHVAIGQREQRPVAPHADIATGVKLGATLANNNITGDHCLPAKFLNTQSLACAVTTVAGAALSFFMCHDLCANFVNLDKGKILPMAVLVAIPFASFHLPNNELFASGVLDHFGLDLGSLDRRGADLH